MKIGKIVVATIVLLTSFIVFFALSTGGDIGEANSGSPESTFTISSSDITVKDKTSSTGEIYHHLSPLCSYTIGDSTKYYRLTFALYDGKNSVDYIASTKDVTVDGVSKSYKTVNIFEDAALTNPSISDLVAFPGSITYNGKEYPVNYNGIVLETRPDSNNSSGINTVTWYGNPKFLKNTYPTLTDSSIDKVVFMGSPVFEDGYTLAKTVTIDGNNTIFLNEIVFKNNIVSIPELLIAKNGKTNPVGELKITFESTVGSIPQALKVFKYSSDADDKAKLTYWFGEHSSRPSTITTDTRTSYMDVTIVIDTLCEYWTNYLADGKLDDSGTSGLNDLISSGMLTVRGDHLYQINVNVTNGEGGKISVLESASPGMTVRILGSPNDGYILGELSAHSDAGVIQIGSDNSFIMPSADVTISAIFVKVVPIIVDVTSSGSEASLHVSISGTQNGSIPHLIKAYVKYGNDSTGDRFVRMEVPIINYNGTFETVLISSMTSFTPNECLVQIFSESGILLNQKIVSIGN